MNLFRIKYFNNVLIFICAVITFCCTSPFHSSPVDNQEAFLSALKSALPGDTILIKDGIYYDWSVLIDAEGTSENKITIKPESINGVVFSASKLSKTHTIKITGKQLVLDGFIFKDILFDQSTLVLVGSKNVRITNCTFQNIRGDGRERRMFVVHGNTDNTEIDHCIFENNDLVQTITLRVGELGFPTNSHIHHNTFHNLNLNAGDEGSETIQLSQTTQGFNYTQLCLKTIVEDNHFENIRGDAETISNKSNENTIRRNTLINCNQLVLRGGHNCLLEDNKLIDSQGPAIRIYGSGHVIQNNTIKNPTGNGISMCYGMGSGIKVRTHRITSTNSIVKNNLIEGAGEYGIFLGEGKGTDYSGHKNAKRWNTGVIQDIPPSGNSITSNKIVNSKNKPIEIAGAAKNVIVNNVYE
ncbi:MAG: hypothetical protein HN778_20730 [Prolixibacteraceae bacterium]|nr:hypothetical protein [Prolixibacteraceae bacterium]MBT7000446.1 hypothetical protein [Prolixibacteraceae bacterium]MBT7397261.1 hypothetical protein [Prolixibacteraceae bacterium]